MQHLPQKHNYILFVFIGRAANAFFQITAVMLIACVILFAVAVLFLSLNWCINESLIQLNSRATYYANLGVGILAVASESLIKISN